MSSDTITPVEAAPSITSPNPSASDHASATTTKQPRAAFVMPVGNPPQFVLSTFTKFPSWLPIETTGSSPKLYTVSHGFAVSESIRGGTPSLGPPVLPQKTHPASAQDSPLSLGGGPPPGCNSTMHYAFTIQPPPIASYKLGLFSLWNGSLYEVGRGAQGYLTTSYQLKFHRLPVSDQAAHRPFSVCPGNELAFADYKKWYWCEDGGNKFLTLHSNLSPGQCQKKAVAVDYHLAVRVQGIPLAHDKIAHPPESSLNVAAIAGGSVSAFVVIAFLVGVAIFLRKSKKTLWEVLRPAARASPAQKGPVFEKDSPHGQSEVANRPPTDMIDSVPVSELHGSSSDSTQSPPDMLDSTPLAELPATQSTSHLPLAS